MICLLIYILVCSFPSCNDKMYLYFHVGVTVSLQGGDQFVDEGDPVSICVALSDVPSGGLECDVVVLLNTADGKASKLTQLQSYFVYVKAN